jgi:hypothetical protein
VKNSVARAHSILSDARGTQYLLRKGGLPPRLRIVHMLRPVWGVMTMKHLFAPKFVARKVRDRKGEGGFRKFCASDAFSGQ